MSEATHARAAQEQKDQTVREERREERAAHAQREDMQREHVAAQRDAVPQQGQQAQHQQAQGQQTQQVQRPDPRVQDSRGGQDARVGQDPRAQESQRHETQRSEAQRSEAQRDESRTGSQDLTQRPGYRLEDEWQAVQFEFVDDPHAAVRKADDLVRKAIEELTSRHRTLSEQWKGEGKHETEDLRLALHRYRELFRSLVATK
ncbi:hypothetical protein BBK82_01595 [Lentzea guizhouensis]|uniref:Uncharacterized protein n=1 Tax=Lentzea guizhouensis TaxID=1586287 RepID=A0A1B2HB64_9PSEU|nr:hypothetical protein [Lentzea guizhouensis]ANZ34958.1 hypothetical protein BBK82_01595 [Lentzea guizhouensis]